MSDSTIKALTDSLKECVETLENEFPEDQWEEFYPQIPRAKGLLESIRKQEAEREFRWKLEDLLDRYNDYPVECDGFTRIATYVLRQEGIDHRCYVGDVHGSDGGFHVCPHYWIEAGPFVIDYRLAFYPFKDLSGMRWRLQGSRPVSELADSAMAVPRGVFRKEDHPEFHYDGVEVQLEVSPIIFDILTAEGVTAKEQVVLDNLARIGLLNPVRSK